MTALTVTPFILRGRSRFRECPGLALVIGLSGGHEGPAQASGQGWTERQARPPAHGWSSGLLKPQKPPLCCSPQSPSFAMNLEILVSGLSCFSTLSSCSCAQGPFLCSEKRQRSRPTHPLRAFGPLSSSCLAANLQRYRLDHRAF